MSGPTMDRREFLETGTALVAGGAGLADAASRPLSTESMKNTYSSIIPRSKVYQSPNCGSMIALKDGRIMWLWGVGGQRKAPYAMQANFSSDGGRTWSDPESVKLRDGSDLVSFLCPSLARLKSGKIGLVHEQSVADFNGYNAQIKTTFHTSDDEGKSWSKGVIINPFRPREWPHLDQLHVLSNGRLIIPFLGMVGPTPKDRDVNFTIQFGEKFKNGYVAAVSPVTAYYSDDEGKTWERSFNEVYASVDRGLDGNYGIWDCGMAELPQGSLLLLMWSGLGRIYRSYSEDSGQTWIEAEPTELQCSGPMWSKGIPATNDVLLIWCQASQWEIMDGYDRHRLSYAITPDGGKTFHSFRNLESLDDVTRIDPEPLIPYAKNSVAKQPLDTVRYHRAPGPLRVDHPFCTFHNGSAVIGYGIGDTGDPEILTRFYGESMEHFHQRFGFEPNKTNPKKIEGSNKVQVIPIKELYSQ